MSILLLSALSGIFGFMLTMAFILWRDWINHKRSIEILNEKHMYRAKELVNKVLQLIKRQGSPEASLELQSALREFIVHIETYVDSIKESSLFRMLVEEFDFINKYKIDISSNVVWANGKVYPMKGIEKKEFKHSIGGYVKRLKNEITLQK